jgi:predicted esterase
MNSPVELGFDHRFIAGERARTAAPLTLLLLHGTGGDGDSLLQLGDTVAPGATLLSPTGKVLEHGARRFFRRLAEGVFDQEDLARRTQELAAFVRGAIDAYRLDPRWLVALGYSNGAVTAASLLLADAGVLAGAVLLRPMDPFTPAERPQLAEIPVLESIGVRDRIATPARGDALATLLMDAGADVHVHREPAGHELTMGDVRVAREWLSSHFGVDVPAA